MIRILRYLLTGDWHLCKWKRINKQYIYSGICSIVYDTDDDLIGIDYVCECEICGKIKSFKVTAK